MNVPILRSTMGVRSSVPLFLLVFAVTAINGADPISSDDFFERQVRPLLVEKCFSCHAGAQRKGKLSLDSHEGLMTGGESGPAVVPGEPDKSRLIEAVNYNGGIQMPPDGRLSDREIGVLKQWVSLGIPWPKGEAVATIRGDGTVTEKDRQFWSFQPIRESPLPTVRRTDWPREALDYFVLHRLETEGIEPVAEADRRTLIRRAAFDLIGLPPTESEINAFVSDERPDAYERLLDRLLDRPEYGERWARHWLDVARYGEDQAHTFQARLYPSGYRYRDWVVNSFNRDLPIDQFLAQQIAGDLMPGDDRASRLPALGFFALGPVYYADAGCAPKAKADEYDDRIDTLCRGILGLTVSCARCHDHKFDPITMKDYYALAGIFASTEYFEAPLVPADVVKTYDDAMSTVKQAEQQHKDAESTALRERSESLVPDVARYLTTAWLVLNRRKSDPAFKVTMALEDQRLAGTRLEEFVVDQWLRFLASDEGKKHPLLSAWRAIVSQQDAALDLPAEVAEFETMRCVASEVERQLLEAVSTRREAMARSPKGEPKRKDAGIPGEISNLLKTFVDNGNAPLAIPKDRADKVLSEETKQSLAALKQAVDDRKQAVPPKYPVAHSLSEGKPTNSRIHLRGNVKDLGDEAPRRFLEVISPAATPFTQGSGRGELAQAIVSSDNPLTARVFVNRVWRHHFGRGIVGTPSNFGLLGERPTHPELLDVLAARFMASGWSLKQLHREIMLSSTYRLSSSHHPQGQERDPGNRLLWRMNRRRLDFESWRDAMLFVADGLDPALGGPSVNLAAGNNRRRTLYAAVSRHELNPTLRLFDFPDANLTSESRAVTTVPMQQLFVLNSDFMVGQARSLFRRLEQEKLPDDDARITRLYGWVFGRSPSERELQRAREFMNAPLPQGVSAGEVKLSRWEQYAQALLGTNEFLFVD